MFLTVIIIAGEVIIHGMTKTVPGARKHLRARNRAGRISGWRLLAARTAMIALLLNVILPLALAMGQAGAAGPGAYLSGIQGETIVICTGAGMRTIQVGPDGKPVSGKMQGDGYCPLCVISGGIGLAPAARTVILLEEPTHNSTWLPLRFEQPRPSIRATRSAPRAPPLEI